MNELLERYPQLGICRNSIEKAVEKIVKCYENGGKVLLWGKKPQYLEGKKLPGIEIIDEE